MGSLAEQAIEGRSEFIGTPLPSIIMTENDVIYTPPRQDVVSVGSKIELTIPIPPTLKQYARNSAQLRFHLCSNLAQAGLDASITRVSEDDEDMVITIVNQGGHAISLDAGMQFSLGQPYVLSEPLTLADINNMLHENPNHPLAKFHDSKSRKPYLRIPVIEQKPQNFIDTNAIPIHTLPRGSQRSLLHPTIGVAPQGIAGYAHETSVHLAETSSFSIPDGFALRILHGLKSNQVVAHSASDILKAGYDHRIITETYGEIDTLVCVLERIQYV